MDSSKKLGRQIVHEFLTGNAREVKGYKFKKIASDGSYIDPVPFFSKRKPPKEKKSKKPTTPPKKVNQYNRQGELIMTHDSLKRAAKHFNTQACSIRRQVKKTGTFRGVILKMS